MRNDAVDMNDTPLRKILILLLALSLAAVCSLDAACSYAADERIRVGVVGFDSRTEGASDRQAAAILNLLTFGLSQSKRIAVYEREQLNSIMAEQKLGNSGLVDEKTAVQLGKIAGIQYMILGSVVQTGQKTSGIYLRIFAAGADEMRAVVSARIVDVSTGEVVFSLMREGSSKNDSFGISWHGFSIMESAFGGLPARAIADAVMQLSADIRYAIAEDFDHVVNVLDDEIYIDVAAPGEGTLYLVYLEGEEITDLEENLLDRQRKPVAILKVSDVRVGYGMAGYSIAKVVPEGGSIKNVARGDKIEPISQNKAKEYISKLPKAGKRPKVPAGAADDLSAKLPKPKLPAPAPTKPTPVPAENPDIAVPEKPAEAKADETPKPEQAAKKPTKKPNADTLLKEGLEFWKQKRWKEAYEKFDAAYNLKKTDKIKQYRDNALANIKGEEALLAKQAMQKKPADAKPQPPAALPEPKTPKKETQPTPPVDEKPADAKPVETKTDETPKPEQAAKKPAGKPNADTLLKEGLEFWKQKRWKEAYEKFDAAYNLKKTDQIKQYRDNALANMRGEEALLAKQATQKKPADAKPQPPAPTPITPAPDPVLQPERQSIGAAEFMELFKTGTVSQIEAAIASGVDVNARNEDGWTALMYAAGNNSSLGVVETLLRAGADANARAENGWTVLMSAAVYDSNLGVVDALLRAGADANARTEYGWTALMNAAGYNSSLGVVETLLRAGADANAGAEDGWTALMNAARITSNPEIITALIDAGADINALDNNGKNARYWAEGNPSLKNVDMDKLFRLKPQPPAALPEPKTPEKETQPTPPVDEKPADTKPAGENIKQITNPFVGTWVAVNGVGRNKGGNSYSWIPIVNGKIDILPRISATKNESESYVKISGSFHFKEHGEGINFYPQHAEVKFTVIDGKFQKKETWQEKQDWKHNEKQYYNIIIDVSVELIDDTLKFTFDSEFAEAKVTLKKESTATQPVSAKAVDTVNKKENPPPSALTPPPTGTVDTENKNENPPEEKPQQPSAMDPFVGEWVAISGTAEFSSGNREKLSLSNGNLEIKGDNFDASRVKITGYVGYRNPYGGNSTEHINLNEKVEFHSPKKFRFKTTQQTTFNGGPFTVNREFTFSIADNGMLVMEVSDKIIKETAKFRRRK
ncbi:MAG: ankyrin repeat domain-containing protein [Synergistaceae bacterium]|jgi:ankyrin repeat protein/curli biogenesis system outer membrane secretion channel CsgG|nr:ankyrin repeat domain-containing protein [Synergistaceae bacterium]